MDPILNETGFRVKCDGSESLNPKDTLSGGWPIWTPGHSQIF